MKKPYQKPSVTKVVLNPAQAVLSVCSHAAPAPNKAGGTSNTCRSSGPAPKNCMKKAPLGDSAAAC